MKSAPEPSVNADFVDVLASGVHDTKNTLFDALGRVEFVRSSLAAVAGTDPAVLGALTEAAGAVERSAERLAKILSAYRLMRHENPVVLLPTPLAELAEYVRLRAADGWRSAAELVVTPVPDLVWLLDRELIADCLVNALTNAARYAQRKVVLDIRTTADWLSITVADDGTGYPESIIGGEVPFSSVGLFIARKLAAQHVRNGRTGSLVLANRQDGQSGAIFNLMLP